MSEERVWNEPLISVVIPTYRRPETLRVAVASILSQTYGRLELMVVSDGPDAETAEVMREIVAGDARVRYHELGANSGPAEARNVGVRMTTGEWVGFLDDDDEWLPKKLELQIAAMQPGDAERKMMISCRCIYRHGSQDDVWPQRPIREGEGLGEYLMRRPGIFERPGVIAIHTLLVPRGVLEASPLMTEKDHEDWAWMLDAWNRVGARVRFVWEALVVYNIVMDGMSRSRRLNWEESLEFADKYKEGIGRRGYNSFLATKVALKAKRGGDRRGLWTITKRVMGNGPGWLDGLFLFGMWVLPDAVVYRAWKKSLEAGKK